MFIYENQPVNAQHCLHAASKRAGGNMRKKDETLRDILLGLAREIIAEQGTDALNIRTLAKRAGVASGTVYNYFANKDDILLVLTEEYWRKTLQDMHDEICAERFFDQVREMYIFLKDRVSSSAGILMASLSNAEGAGRQRMQAMQMVIRKMIIERLDRDTQIKASVWNETLTKEQFADFVMMNLMMMLRMRAQNIDTFTEILKRILKENENGSSTYRNDF